MDVASYQFKASVCVMEQFTPLRNSRSIPKRSRDTKVELPYASGTNNSIYHLVMKNDLETLCGLRVSRLRSQQGLHLVTEVSAQSICKHCERIQQNAESQEGS